MRKFYLFLVPAVIIAAIGLFVLNGSFKNEGFEEEMDEYDGPDKAIEFEIERTKNPFTGRVPWDKLRLAIEQTEAAKSTLPNSPTALSWIERGPNGDFFGPQGNSRPNNDQTAGRIRASLVDSLDPTGKTVWVGCVSGGLWKTTDITSSPSNWTLVDDKLANLAVAAICQDPRPGFQNNMYFCTGESFGNADAVRGIGVFKSTDGGATWSFLSSTSSYINGTRIVCDYQGNVYLGTRNTGLLRSTNGGTSWTNITPSGLSANIADIEISSTSGPGRLHVATGISSASSYRYTDIPATVTAATWDAPIVPYTSFNQRTELGINGNVLYALPNNASNQVGSIWKTDDGGSTWTVTATQPTSGWASGQGWYALSCGVNPANPDECIVGGLDCFKTSNGGGSWTKISTWAGFSGQYVHADQHNIQWWDGGNKLMFNCDGGVHFSTNGGVTITDRNKGLRLKQFYSVAIHPTATNYFLAGAQDNGVHRLNHPGLDSSIEVYGGDGCYVAIDQNQPQYQFGSYVYNVYRRSTNNGVSWNTPVNNQSSGRFVNPWDYDNNANIIYACNNAGTFLRWNDPQTGSTTEVVTASAFGGANVSAVHASPYTANRVYFGMGSGGIIAVDNANTGTTVTGTVITPAGAAGYANCVVTGSSDQNLMATYSSYGVNNVWVSTNGGTSWTACDGNLPDMPVRWALFHPDGDNKAFIATETGVWETDLLNGAATVWVPNASFPNVRTDMIKYRSSDRTIAAGTHGRGIWSANIPAGCVSAGITSQPSNSTICSSANTSFSVTATGTSFQWQESINGGATWTNITNGGVYSGAATTTLNLTGVTIGMNTYQYRCVVLGDCNAVPANSSAGVLTVNAAAAITTQPAASTICSGTNTSFTTAATGASLSYQWQVSTDGGVTFNNVTNGGVYSGATTTTLNITGAAASMNNNRYRCVVNSSCGALNSAAVILTVNTTPAISSQPANTAVCAGNFVTFSVTAAATGIGYQWQESTNGGGTWNNIAGANAASYSFTATLAQNNYQYRCIITGTCTPSVNSTAAVLTVGSTLVVNTQPANTIVCAGATATYNVNVSGTVTYQWQESTNGGVSYSSLVNGGIYAGATTATLTLTGVPASANNNLYRCIISGNCPSINSNGALLNVNTAPAITTQPPANITVCATQNALVTVVAGGTGLGYQWQVSTNGGSTFTNLTNAAPYTGVTTNTLTVTGTTAGMNGSIYHCVISGACAPAATTANTTLTVNTPVSVTASPLNSVVCENSNASFSITAAGTAPAYQWQVSTNSGATFTNVANGGVYSGATTAILTLAGVTAGLHNNQYRCVVTGATSCGNTTSGTGILSVNNAPAAYTVTGGGSYCSGGTGVPVGLNNSATGINYQLQVNGVNSGTPVAGTGAAISFGNKTAAGTYTVIATNNTTGCTLALPGSVTVGIYPQPTVTLSAAPYLSVFPGLTTTLTANAVSGTTPYAYTWLKNNQTVSNSGNTYAVNVTNMGNYRVIVTDANGCVAQSQPVTIADSANNKLFIYPSPNDGRFNVVYYNQGNAPVERTLSIYSSKGEKVYYNKFTVNQAYQVVAIDLSRNGADVYYVVLGDGSGAKLKTGEVMVR